MDQKKRVSSLKQYPVLAAFTLFFAALFVLDLVTPDRAYSELENTTLTQRPKLTAVSVDGLNNYFTNYTKYVKDQVFGRDQWISLQSLAETTLFQKTQSGGILLGREHRMFARRYRACDPRPLDCDAMRAGAAGLVGTHDFFTFCANRQMKKSTVRTLRRLDITQEDAELCFTLTADGFLYHMARILVGTLLEVGLGRRPAESLPALFDARCRALAGETAPAKGLWLMEVRY